MPPGKDSSGSVDTSDSEDHTRRLQLLVSDPGNRRAISAMVSDHFDVETDQSVVDADLYLVEDRLFPTHREDLRARVEQDYPLFCPIVLIRRDGTTMDTEQLAPRTDEDSLLVDDFVDAPLDRTSLLRRLHSLFVRRQQSRELTAHVSTLERRERELRRFERAVEGTNNAIAIMETDGTIGYVNSAFETVTGYTEPDAIDRSLRFLGAETLELFNETFWRTMRERESWEGEIVVERRNGQRRIVDLTITTITTEDGNTEGFVAVVRDITERIQRERALRDREEELDLLRQILTRYLRHNLRNDLNVIQGNAELIAEAVGGETGRSAETILETAKELVEMSDTARLYSSLTERDGELSRYDLSDIVAEAATEITARYPDTSIETETPETCSIAARDGIRKAIAGLIENAAKHNDSDDPWVRISVRATENPQVTIEDNGPGLPEHELTAFNQGEESPLAHSSGIGVWLSKWVIEGSGGRLSFDSTANGTRVTAEFSGSGPIDAETVDVSDLKANERRLRTIIDRMTDAIIEIGPDWRIEFVDDHAEAVFGVDAESVSGRPFWDVFPELEATPLGDVSKETMENRTGGRIEVNHPEIGSWIETYVYPDFDGGISLYCRDISERKHREEQLTQTRELLERAERIADVGAWEIDAETLDVFWSENLFEILGVAHETEPPLEKALDVYHEADRPIVENAVETALETGEPFDIEVRFHPSGDDVGWLRVRGEPAFEDGSIVALRGVVQDVTDRKQRERELQERIKELTAIKRTAEIFERREASLDELLEEFVETLPFSFQYPDTTAVRLEYGDKVLTTDNYEPSDQRLTAETRTDSDVSVLIEVVYLDPRPAADLGPFLEEERELLETLVTLIRTRIERETYTNELVRTSELLADIERLGGVGAWELNENSGDAYWTAGTRRLHGVDEEFTPLFGTLFEFAHPDDREKLVSSIERALETGESFETEYRLHTATGTERVVRAEGESVSKDDNPGTVRGYLQEITEGWEP